MGTTVEDMVAREKRALSMLSRGKGVTPAELGEACEILPRVAAYLLERLENQGYARHCGEYRWIVYHTTAEGAEKAYAAREGERSKAMQEASSIRSNRIPGTFDRADKNADKPKKTKEAAKSKKKAKKRSASTEIATAITKEVKIVSVKNKHKGKAQPAFVVEPAQGIADAVPV
jgi:hypothetical protein